MARKRQSPLVEIIEIASRLSWKVNIVIALVAFVIIHQISIIQLDKNLKIGEIGIFAVKQMMITMAIFGQMVIPFAFLLAALVSFIKARKQEKLYNNVASRQDTSVLGDMSWREFEMMLGEFFRRRGFSAVLTGEGADGGVDIVLKKDNEKYLVQCKQWKAYKVGVQPVRELYGVMASVSAAGGYFVTSGVYTSEAEKFAEGLNICLIDGPKLLRMVKEVQQPAPIEVDQTPDPQLPVAPDCPKCGSRMTKRVARQGVHSGKEFWGCTTYPKCNGARS
jgi:restriction system protein